MGLEGGGGGRGIDESIGLRVEVGGVGDANL